MEKVQKKLGEGCYRTREEFKYDITKIFDNARIYNQEETIYYKYANQLQGFVKPQLERVKEATSLTPAEIDALVGSRKKLGVASEEEEEGSSKKVPPAN